MEHYATTHLPNNNQVAITRPLANNNVYYYYYY